jgi:hypothetical protein
VSGSEMSTAVWTIVTWPESAVLLSVFLWRPINSGGPPRSTVRHVLGDSQIQNRRRIDPKFLDLRSHTP